MLVIGSRGSQLALWQANYIQQRLAEHGIEARIEIIHTTGDRITNVPLSTLGAMTSTKGLFTKELEEALLDGRIHLAVHSLKDMPTDLPPGLRLAAIPAREDVRDAVIGKTLDELPQGARVGTSALRRQAQLHALRHLRLCAAGKRPGRRPPAWPAPPSLASRPRRRRCQ